MLIPLNVNVKQQKFERDMARCWCDPGWEERKSRLGMGRVEEKDNEIDDVKDDADLKMLNEVMDEMSRVEECMEECEGDKVMRMNVMDRKLEDEKTALTKKEDNWRRLEEGRRELQRMDMKWNTMR